MAQCVCVCVCVCVLNISDGKRLGFVYHGIFTVSAKFIGIVYVYLGFVKYMEL